ncbi:MAG: hypothetical protein R3C59_26430 [Planctomycetaceae bacterium]
MDVVRCEGWWEQAGYGRQPMHGLRLRFDDRLIVGEGFDIIGPFTLEGFIRQGVVNLQKHYKDAHSVDYPGTFDGEGTLQGHWSIHGFGGRWLIKVVALEPGHPGG